MLTMSANPRSNAGPDTAGPVTARATGTIPEHAAIARAAVPHPCRAATPSNTSAPLDATTPTSGRRTFNARAAAAAILRPAASERAPAWCDGSTRNMTRSRSPARPAVARTAPGTRAARAMGPSMTPWNVALGGAYEPQHDRPCAAHGAGPRRRRHPRMGRAPQRPRPVARAPAPARRLVRGRHPPLRGGEPDARPRLAPGADRLRPPPSPADCGAGVVARPGGALRPHRPGRRGVAGGPGP